MRTSEPGVRWTVAVIDRPFRQLSEAAAFWAAVSGTVAQPPKYERFVELRRARTDDWLLVQGVLDGPGGVHLDLSVDDVPDFCRWAVGAGATPIADHGSWRVLTSPAGLPFCVAAWRGEHRRPAPWERPDGGYSGVPEVCLEIGPTAYDVETAFWPESVPVRLRRGEEGPLAACLGIPGSAVAAARTWHERLGATVVDVAPGRIRLLDPAGSPYCLIEQS